MEREVYTKIARAILSRRGSLITENYIAALTGYSPSEVAQVIEDLENLGFGFEPRCSKLFVGMPPPITEARVAGAEDVIVADTVPSTMDLAKELVACGVSTPLVVFAEGQTAGRGRDGRRWISHGKLGFYFTIALKADALTIPVSLCGIAAGLGTLLATVNHCRELKGHLQIKWPNDIYLDGAKLAGILTEKKGDYVYIGCGLNVYHLEGDLPENVYYDTTSLLIAGVFVEDRDLLAAEAAGRTISVTTQWDVESILRSWHDFDYLYERLVRVESGNTHYRGKAVGVNAEGALRLATATGIINVVSGDVILIDE